MVAHQSQPVKKYAAILSHHSHAHLSFIRHRNSLSGGQCAPPHQFGCDCIDRARAHTRASLCASGLGRCERPFAIASHMKICIPPFSCSSSPCDGFATTIKPSLLAHPNSPFAYARRRRYSTSMQARRGVCSKGSQRSARSALVISTERG